MTDCTDLGKAYMRQGLNVLVLGLLLGMIPVTHYMLGAIAGDVGHHFMKNITLWWGCPAILMELTCKVGGLGLMGLGLAYRAFPRDDANEGLTAGEGRAPKLCAYALYGGAIYAGVGFVVCNMIWPNFYFEHVEAGKNAWLAGQWLAIAIYIGGLWPSVSALKANHLQ